MNRRIPNFYYNNRRFKVPKYKLGQRVKLSYSHRVGSGKLKETTLTGTIVGVTLKYDKGYEICSGGRGGLRFESDKVIENCQITYDVFVYNATECDEEGNYRGRWYKDQPEDNLKPIKKKAKGRKKA